MFFSWRSRDAKAEGTRTTVEEATSVAAWHGGSAGDQEIPEVHGASDPLCTICPSGAWRFGLPPPLEMFGMQTV
jgi:hypothetical protein